MSEIYTFSHPDAQGQSISLSQFQGKVLLVVNTATRCGLTPQYEQLQQLHEKYHEQGLVILDFPCNQFREQAPESGAEISQFCQTKFGTQFTIFDKVDVNGDNTHPLYRFLKQRLPEDRGNVKFQDLLIRLASLGEKREGNDIKWNFTKFLINRKGEAVARFAPSVTPNEIVSEIENLLAQTA